MSTESKIDDAVLTPALAAKITKAVKQPEREPGFLDDPFDGGCPQDCEPSKAGVR